MRILVRFRNDWLVGDVRAGSPPGFFIAWEHDGTYYPDENWEDLGAVVLGWWLVTVGNLLRGAPSAEFVFMDGPYFLQARHDRASGLVEVRPEGMDVVWRAPLVEVAQEIVRAASTVCRKLADMGLGQDDRVMLQKGIDTVREIMGRSRE